MGLGRWVLLLWLLGLLGETWWSLGWCECWYKEVVNVVRTLKEDSRVVVRWFVARVLECVGREICMRCLVAE